MKIKVLLIGLMFLLPGLTFMIGSWGAYWLDTSIREHGPQSVGHVTKKLILHSDDGSDHIVEYWFKLPDGRQINMSRGVSKDLWDSLSSDKLFTVVYSAENPNRNFPLGSGVTSLGLTIYASIFGLIFTVFGALIIAGSFFPKQKNPTKTN